MTARDIVMGAAGNSGDSKTYVEDVFSTYLYTGTDTSQTINNGIDLAGKGGLTWIKSRNGVLNNVLFDTTRGTNNYLVSNTTAAAATTTLSVESFNNNGFSINGRGTVGASGTTYASWTFRKAPKFFDVVTYTGNGVDGRAVDHNLGYVPGMIIVKRTSSSGTGWKVYHRSTTYQNHLFLNTTDAQTSGADWYAAPTSTQFFMRGDIHLNTSGQTYVAYLFAHDTSTDGLIQCGSYSGNGTSQNISLGWEPQYVLIKSTNVANDWFIMDTMRGQPVSGNAAWLRANTTDTELSSGSTVFPNATGFTASGTGTGNASGETYIYMAIRRPMKVPTDGTKVFKPTIGAGGAYGQVTNFPVDMGMVTASRSSPAVLVSSRLQGKATGLYTNSTTAEFAETDIVYDSNTGYMTGSYSGGNGYINNISWAFRRAPGFFDVVCYTGTGVARTVNHNLVVAPELMIVKNRGALSNWIVYAAPLGATKALSLNVTNAAVTDVYWNNTVPTSTVFSLLSGTATNGSGSNYVAYLFASCPGVSKVGTFEFTGAALNIDCGFTNGSRFVMVKRTDSTGNWYVWDTARGIVAGNDPYLYLNSSTAETTGYDTIDPYAAGFSIPTNALNAGTYIYLAIA